MSFTKKVAGLLAMIMIVSMFGLWGGALNASAAVRVGGPRFDQETIDAAVKVPVAGMNITPDFKWGVTLHNSEVIFYLALASYYNPNLTSSGGTKVSNRLIAHLTYLISGGKEPACRGALSGWIDGPVANALALAKHTPAVWNELGMKDKEKLDFIMKYMAVVYNYTHNYKNDPRKDLSQEYDFNKSWNPNMQEGSVHAMAAIYIYFGGADAVNKILADFNYDDYIAKMDEYKFTNVKLYFEKTGKKLLEEGGVDAGGGIVHGAKIPFTYKDVITGEEVPFEPYALFRSTALRQFSKIVKSSVYEGRGRIADGSKSPFEGRLGMCTEFEAMDANGVRTNAHYVADSLRNTIPSRATLEALGYWKGDDIRDIEERMYVGVEDFLYKIDPAHGGWIGHQKGKDTHDLEENFDSYGYQFYKDVWLELLKSDYVADCTVSEGSDTATAKCTFYNYLKSDIPVKVIFAAYDRGNRLVGIDVKPLTVKSDGGTEQVSTARPNNSKIRVFLYDNAKGLQEVSLKK